MNVFFADAFYFLARLSRRDQHHERVLKFPTGFQARLLTSNWGLTEVADAFAGSESHTRVRDFILQLRQSATCAIVPATRQDLARALELDRQHSDKAWTRTDCASFIIKRERNKPGALTGDKRFEQAGFAALL